MFYQYTKYLIAFLILATSIQPMTISGAENPAYRIVHELDDLPFKEVTDLLYDSDGLLWIATRNGLYCYDSYRLRPYRCDARHRDMLSGNEVKRINEDQEGHIWISTAQGVDRLDKHTGRIEHISGNIFPPSGVNEMITTRNGHVWFASDLGFHEYDPATNEYTLIDLHYEGSRTPQANGQCLLEDHRGYIWLGTWSDGLFRYDPKTHETIHYPQLNARNSAHVLLEDDAKRIWVGGWASGVHVLQNAWDVDNLQWETYTAPDLIGDITYSMTLDPDHHQIMIGSSRGMTLASTKELGHFTKLIDSEGLRAIPGVEITGIERSADGLYWISMIGDGVKAIEPDQERFGRSTFGNTFRSIKTSSVRSIYADHQNRLWLGIGTQGLAVQELSTGKTYNWNEIPALAKALKSMTTVYAITETFDHHIWVATYSAEILDITPPAAGEDIRKLKVEIHNSKETPMAPSELVFSFFEDDHDYLWTCGKGGVTRRSPDGSIERFDSMQMDPEHRMTDLDIRKMMQDGEGNYWLAALHGGVYRMKPQGKGWEASFYNINNEGIADNEIQCLCIDHEGHIWAGSNYGDLYYLDTQHDQFISVKEAWHLPGASIVFIYESPTPGNNKDIRNSLWVGTNEGLLQIIPNEGLASARVTHYTVKDGLLGNQLIRNAVTADNDGKVYFGTYQGYNCFDASALMVDGDKPKHIALSDLFIDDEPWAELPEQTRFGISPLAPRYTDQITLDHTQNSFSMEFVEIGALYKIEGSFAYRLEGFDKEWRYTWDGLPRVYYSNLPPGNYTFKIYVARSSVTDGSLLPAESDNLLQISVCILPPWYHTHWAHALYVLFCLLGLFLIYRGIRSLKVYWKRLLLGARERAALRKGDIIIKASRPEVTDVDKEFISRAIQLINQHLSDADYDQQRLLDDMGVSKATFFRKLKALTGQSYTNFVRDIKMKAAMKIQQNDPNIRISDLAYAVGFSDPKYFSSCFKKYFGKLPSEVSNVEKYNK